MAVTGRDLHPQPAGNTVAAPRIQWPQVQVDRQYLRIGGLILFGVILLNLALGRGQLWLDDLRYGRPRTMQLSEYVGHNERPGQPSHFVAMNLNRRVVVIELPGGDSSKAQTLQGPYLFGANEHLTPVLLRVQDVNNDKKGDLVIAVKNEEIIYVNTGDTFRLITDDERQQLVGAQQ
ncbi:MAG: hypothetical protein M3R24_03105 [Chloroflexota bacterium]|nr:hypothetical protein [Chloroflexota bacterium]PLS80930.1 MAG: hypothetical protein CYG59_06840 [Chloroflexota bacterium]